jgi:hypothetical protein
MKTISEDQARTVDTICKVVTALALVVGGFIALFQYSAARHNELTAHQNEVLTRNLELKKPFLEKRLDFCIKATTETATIATDKDKARVADAKRDFLILSEGPFNILADMDMRERIRLFRNCITNDPCTQSLTGLSMDLANSCANALSVEWGAPTRPKLTVLPK